MSKAPAIIIYYSLRLAEIQGRAGAHPYQTDYACAGNVFAIR